MAKTKEAKNHSRSTVWKQVKVNWQMYLFLLLPVIWLIVFKYVPMYGAQIAFRDYTIQGGFTGSKWVGLKHFNRFFTSYSFGNTLSNTLILSFYSLIVGFPLPIIFALLLNSVRSKRWKSVVENVTYMPNFISAVVMVGMLFRVMDVNSGLLANIYCALTGAKQLPFNAMASGWGFRHLYVWSGVWQDLGYSSIIYIAALSGVSPELHEAAIVDGASILRRIRHIDIPSVLPTFCILLIMRCGSLLSVGFEKALLLQNPLNMAVSEVISTYSYNISLNSTSPQFSYAAAIGLFTSVINLIVLCAVNGVVGRVSDNSIF